MISFVTLLLGIVVGVVDVTVLPGVEVAAVELRMDGKTVERLESGPWTFSIDFGERPAPRELLAVALSADGRELGRTRQWVNLPRAEADLDVSLSESRDGQGMSAAVTWESVGGRNPRTVIATLDGAELEFADPSRIALPPVNMETVHFLRVEAEFEHGPVGAEVVFGGQYVEQAHAELSSVPVALESDGELEPADLEMTAAGRDVPVVAVERGLADVVFVVDPRALPTMPGLTAAAGSSRDRRYARAAVMTDKIVTPREPELNLRLLWAVPQIGEREAAGMDYRLFPSTPDSPPQAGGLLWSLASARFPGGKGRVRLADAVAVAGVMASARGRRRAVVLLLGGSPIQGGYGGEGARGYLEDLRVPFYVWSTTRASDEDLREWGAIDVLDGTRELQDAWQRLNRDLDRQRIVWIEGTHMPNTLEVAHGSVSLAGAGSR